MAYAQQTWIDGTGSGTALSAARLNHMEAGIASAGGIAVNVQDYGAVGNGTTDDTTALQNAITFATANSRLLIFPTATYRITAPLVIAATSRWVMEGAGSTLLMATNNTPILRFTKEDTWGWTLQNFNFTWQNNQASYPSSIAVAFDPDTHTGHGIYHFVIRNTKYDNCYSGIGILQASTVSNPIWGCIIETVIGGPATTGPLIALDQTAGAPNILIRHFYARRDQGTEPAVVISNGSVQIDGWEVNQGTDSQLLLMNCNSILVNRARVETLTVSTPETAVFDIQNSHGSVNSTEFQSITFAQGVGNNAYLLSAAASATVAFNSVHLTGNTFTSGNTYTLRAGGSNYVEFNGYVVSGSAPSGQNALDGTGTRVARANDQFGRGVVHGQNILPSSSGTVTFNARNGDVHVATLTGNATSSSITNPTAGQVITIEWVQDATGSRTYVWPGNCKFAGGAAPTASTTASYGDAVTFRYDGANWREVSRAAAVH